MTEAEWLTCIGEPLRMLAYLQNKPIGWGRGRLNWFGMGCDRPSNRKSVLFACACLRNVVRDESRLAVVQAVERFGDGLIDKDELKRVLVMADQEFQRLFFGVVGRYWVPD